MKQGETAAYILDLHLDTIKFFPIGENATTQIHRFAEEVVPAVRDAVRVPAK